MEEKKVEEEQIEQPVLPDLDYYNVPTCLNAFAVKAEALSMMCDLLACVDPRYGRNGVDLREAFGNLRWNPLDSFRLVCLDIAYRILSERERFTHWVGTFVEQYLCIQKLEQGEEPPTDEEIGSFFKEFMEAFFRGLGVYDSEIELSTHRIYCFRYMLLSLVENQLTVKRTLKGFNLIAYAEEETRGWLHCLLNSKTHGGLFDLSIIPRELQKPEVLSKIRLLIEAGFLDNQAQPSTATRAELATIAESLCLRFSIQQKNGNVNWQLFEQFWGLRNLRQYLNYRKNEVGQDTPRMRKIKEIINE